MDECKDIMVTARIPIDSDVEYPAHLLCLGGSAAIGSTAVISSFYRESLINAMQAAMLDFFDFYARIHARSDISRLLRDKSLSFVQISDMFGFSSPSYFSRYVQQNLGLNPTDYRK